MGPFVSFQSCAAAGSRRYRWRPDMLLGSWSLYLPVSTQRSCEALNGGLLTSVLAEMLSAATG
jgi:hypothetical protein